MGSRPNPVGRRIGRLVVVKIAHGYWTCRCDCGVFKTIHCSSRAKSCGCLKREVSTRILLEARPKGRKAQLASATKHGFCSGGKNHPEYTSYLAAKARCQNTTDWNWNNYGGRGIEFRFKSFEDWIKELGPRPAPKYLYSVNRIDNNGHYETGNVEWATAKVQSNNRRRRCV